MHVRAAPARVSPGFPLAGAALRPAPGARTPVTPVVCGPCGIPTVRATAVLAAFRTDSPVNIDLSVPVWTIEHVAAALHCSVDAAREHTYRADFPRPRAGFSKNLWTRTEVLAWFDALPPRPPGRAGNGAVSTATVARTAPRPAGTRPAAPPATSGARHQRRAPGRDPSGRWPARRRPQVVHAEAEVTRAGNPPIDTIG